MSPMERWDTDEAPKLRAIELCSKKLIYYARALTSVINSLETVPPFETRAQDKLKEAKPDVAEVMARIDAALHRYGSLETTLEAAE